MPTFEKILFQSPPDLLCILLWIAIIAVAVFVLWFLLFLIGTIVASTWKISRINKRERQQKKHAQAFFQAYKNYREASIPSCICVHSVNGELPVLKDISYYHSRLCLPEGEVEIAVSIRGNALPQNRPEPKGDPSFANGDPILMMDLGKRGYRNNIRPIEDTIELIGDFRRLIRKEMPEDLQERAPKTTVSFFVSPGGDYAIAVDPENLELSVSGKRYGKDTDVDFLCRREI